MSSDDQYEAQNDAVGNDVPAGDAQDNDYVSRPGQSEIPVVKDSANVEDPIPDDGSADSDEQLARDDTDAIDQSNIIDERTRGAAKSQGSYAEPGDEEGLPTDDGTSSGRQ